MPATCKLETQMSEDLHQKLLRAVDKSPIKILAIYKTVEVSYEEIKNVQKFGCLIVTDSHLYLTKSDFSWTFENQKHEIQIFAKQPMTNLVQLDTASDSTAFVLNFMDESEDRTELWKFEFESKSCVESSLKLLDDIWSKLFGVSLFE